MRKPTRVLLAAAALALLAVAVLPAQSLLDNEYYYKARDLQYQSEVALNAGEYDKAAALADEARGYLAQSDAYVAEMTRFYRANGWLSVANDRLRYARSISADVNFKDQYDLAAAKVADAKTSMDAKEYEDSVAYSKEAIEALKDVVPVAAAVVEPVEDTGPSWPEFYVVRLITGRRDCFWRIAEYPFVYGDPWKWKLLYEENKWQIPDPANPDLIEPGIVLKIPSLAGEKREGTWDPDTFYPPLP
jgi:tetratricopeptide (TPR) repeat protein